MKKCLFIVFSFIFLLFSNVVDAKSVSDSDLVVSFGNGDRLDLAYTNISSFKINDDKSFYFNGVKHQFNDDYNMVDNTISVDDTETFEMENDTFIVDLTRKIVTSSKIYQTYMFDVEVDVLKDKTYTFTQKICYKYDSNEMCNIDIGDISEISRDDSFSYYYDFFPFYNESIVFDYISYQFTFNDGNTDVIKILSFDNEEINYKDSFKLMAYASNNYLSYYSSNYKGKNYVQLGYNNSTEEYWGMNRYYIFINIVSLNLLDVERKYNVTFYICLPDKECQKINNEFVVVGSTSSASNIYSLPLYYYLYQDNKLIYDHFSLKAEYVYKSGNDTYSRRQTTGTYTGEVTYYVSETNPVFKGTLDGKNDDYNVLVSNDEVTDNILFEDDNGVEKIYYYVSDKQLDNNSYKLINIEVNSGNNISFGSDLEGFYYLYFKVLDGTGMNHIYYYVYLFDKQGPTLYGDNFEEYDSNSIYSDVNIIVSYVDNEFPSVSGIYYKVISEDEYNTITVEDVIGSNNIYNNGVSIKAHISSDGVYRVCFVAYDYLNNYTIDCSLEYYLDITGLTKEEISVSDVDDGYLNELNLIISISGIEEKTSFKCGVFNKDLDINEVMLTSTCLNNVSNKLTFLGEGEYRLWIYASDVAGNYNLVELDQIYYLDNMAPRVSYSVNGDSSSYSNNVKLNVSVNDLNNITSSYYSFYQGSYDNNKFEEFNINDGINYPYNYYGEYKVVIKVCDVSNNCDISISNQIFKIDTGEIRLTLIGEDEVVILRYGKYIEEGAIVSKGINNTRVNIEYSISGDVDVSKVGEYYLIYTSGTGMNEVSIVRKIIVKDSMPYVYLLIGSLLVGELIIFARLFIKKRKNDSI